jgi:hypothetical protein
MEKKNKYQVMKKQYVVVFTSKMFLNVQSQTQWSFPKKMRARSKKIGTVIKSTVSKKAKHVII